MFGRRRERRSTTRRPRRCPNLCLRGRYFSSFPCRRAGRLRVVARHVFFYCGVDVQEGFSTASNGAAALKKPPCPKLCFCAAVFCVFRAAVISVPIRRRRRPPSTPPPSCIATTEQFAVLRKSRSFVAPACRTFMKLCQHFSIQKEAPEQELSGASFFRTCISLCASEAVFVAPARRSRRHPPFVLLGSSFFAPLAPLVLETSIFCDLFAPLRHRAGSTAPQVGERKCKKARPRASMTVH